MTNDVQFFFLQINFKVTLGKIGAVLSLHDEAPQENETLSARRLQSCTNLIFKLSHFK